MNTTSFSEYDDPRNIELFPTGKIFRLSFDSTVRMFKIFCKRYELLEDLRNAFSVPNRSSFFAAQYGYKTDSNLYAINKFGCFSTGLVFEILDYIKQNYGGISVLSMSNNCKRFILDCMTPLKATLQDMQQIYNIADDVGRNNELKIIGKAPYKYRSY